MENATEVYDPHQNPDCTYVDDYYIVMRFWLNVIFGASLSFICIAFNSFVFAVFVTNPQHRNSPNLYMLLLALFDVFMGISYVAVMSVRVFFLWTGSMSLKYFWMQYMVPMLTVSQVAITASTYLITFAAIERYCTSVESRAVAPLQKHRKVIAFIAVMCGVFAKGSYLLEIKTVSEEACKGTFNEWKITAGFLLHFNWYFEYFRFYFRNIFSILAPFFVLTFLNILLIFRLHQQRKIAKRIEHIAEKESVKQKKARIIAVTRTLVIIVCTYLMSNLLGVVIAIWEFVDKESLNDNYTALYVLSVDWISVMTIIASCLRLPIYAIVQPVLRAEMKTFIAQCWTNEKMSRRMTLIENLQLSLPQTMLVQHQDSDVIEFV